MPDSRHGIAAPSLLPRFSDMVAWSVMKPSIRTLVALVTMSFMRLAYAGQITNTLDSVPAGVQCGQTWTNQNIILNFTPTVASEDGSGGACYFGIGPGYVWLYPARLRLDFSLVQQTVSRIEADIHDYCGQNCTALFAYSGTTNTGQVGNSASSTTLSLDFSNPHPDSCAFRSFEATVDEIRIFTEEVSPPRLSIQQTNGAIAILWPASQASYGLQKTVDLTVPSGWITETNNIQLEGTNFVYRPAALDGAEFFRLRLN